MPLAFFSPSEVHVLQKSKYYIINIKTSSAERTPKRRRPGQSLSQDGVDKVVGAAACATGSLSFIYLISSRGLLVKVHLRETTTIQFSTDAFLASSFAPLPAELGQLHSVTSSSPAYSSSTCNCHVTVQGSSASIQFSPHSRSVSNIHVWPFHASVITHAAWLKIPVSVSQSKSQQRRYDQALVTNAGVVLLSSSQSEQQQQRKKEIAFIKQQCVSIASTTAHDVVVITGRVGRVLAIYFKADGSIVTRDLTTTYSPGTKFKLQPVGSNKLRLTTLSSGIQSDAVMTINFETDSRSLSILQGADDDDNVGNGNNGEKAILEPDMNDDSDAQVGEKLKMLLNYIEQIAYTHEMACAERAILNRALKSYNAALLFAHGARSGAHISTKLESDFSFSLTSPTPDSPDHNVSHSAPPVRGRPMFLLCRIRNDTGVALAEGWALHVRLTPRHLRDGDTVKEMRAAIRPLNTGQTVTMSFPTVIASHAPVVVTAMLRFRQAHGHVVKESEVEGGEMFGSKRNKVDISVELCRDKRIDILDISKRLEDGGEPHHIHGLKDKSRQWLTSKLNVAQSQSNKSRKGSHAIVHRLQLPVSRSVILRSLNVKATTNQLHHQHQQYTFETLLDARFSIHVDDVPLLQCPCTITIQGMPYVVPFVRAALLHRVLTETEPLEMRVTGASNIHAWQRSTLDSTENDYTPSAREAEAALVRALSVLDKIEHKEKSTAGENSADVTDEKYHQNNVSIDECEMMKNAAVSAQNLYDKWRQAIEEMWSPAGVKYVTSTGEDFKINGDDVHNSNKNET